MNPLDLFHPAVAAWFKRSFTAPTPPQLDAWAAIQAGCDVLVAAPTGSGKTLAAFLAAIDQLVRQGVDGALPDETRVVYVSPLKALSNDIHRNLEEPVAGIRAELAAQHCADVDINAMVRTGDTSASERQRMRRQPPHILVTTPESLYVMLCSTSGRNLLATCRTVIVDEIHAVAGNKRGSHLALSLERLQALCGSRLQRIGLSATQTPIEDVARFLCGSNSLEAADGSAAGLSCGSNGAAAADGSAAGVPVGSNGAAAADDSVRRCVIVDRGHARRRDLALELPRAPLEAVMSGEVWTEVYDRLAELARDHRTTLVFVNTRRLAERVARHVSERLGREAVAAHHGSMAKERRFDAEQRLKRGELQLLVATASLELGLDIGDVDLVCQIGSTRSIHAFLQRVGRAGHAVGGTSKGRLFPLSRDELVECTALLDAVRRGELDRLVIPAAPLDVLMQQLAAEVSSAEEWPVQALFERVRGAYPYRELRREDFDECVEVLARGFNTRRGRQGALLHHDAVNRLLRARKGTRLTAITSGGAIPDNADYRVLLEPEGCAVGTVNEDFAVESLQGDVFQLGNASYRILRVERGTVRVEDAQGQPPTIPFWLGEAPGRTRELSVAVSRLRVELEPRLAGDDAQRWLMQSVGIDRAAAVQLVDYLRAGRAALNALPSQATIILERFFDESGGMQLVIHSPFGSRVNRAWGLSLRKRFCRTFNFELQAAATEDHIVLSLTEAHSFELAEAARYLNSRTVRPLLVQALCAAPMFGVRWRWVAGIALALPRFRGGKKIPPQISRMQAEDLLAAVFPDQVACAENLPGDIQVPDHPLVNQTIRDCLEDAMDIDAFEDVLRGLESGRIRVLACDLTQPSPLALEALNARPYAYLDDAPLEERRTQAVMSRRWIDAAAAADLGRLDPEAIARVRAEAWPDAGNADELCDALSWLTFLTDDEVAAGRDWAGLLRDLETQRRVIRLVMPGRPTLWTTPERCALFATEESLIDIVRGRLEGLGPVSAADLARPLGLPATAVGAALAALEAEGFVMRGRFTSQLVDEEWCERRLLARIHRYTVKRLRAEIEPVESAGFVRFLVEWQRVLPGVRMQGSEALAALLTQLEGFEAPAAAWEAEVIPARLTDYDPHWLDDHCRAGRFVWARLEARKAGALQGAGPVRSTPITLVARRNARLWSSLAQPPTTAPLHSKPRAVLEYLHDRGASFFEDIVDAVRMLPVEVEESLAELVALGRVHSDSFVGLRALLMPQRSRGRSGDGGRRRRHGLFGMADAGRWAAVGCEAPVLERPLDDDTLEQVTRTLLRRWGVIFRMLLTREATWLPSWRELVGCCRRLEARGELRGGRFVAGFAGEQYATPEAVAMLREVRRRRPTGLYVSVSGADPLNLVGIVTPGARLPSLQGNRLAYRDGVPVAVLAGGEVSFLGSLSGEEQQRAQAALRRRPTADLPSGDPPRLDEYMPLEERWPMDQSGPREARPESDERLQSGERLRSDDDRASGASRTFS